MKTVIKWVAVTALATSSMAASAWWGGGPWNGMGDGFGDGSGSFNIGFSARSSVRGYGNGHGNSYGSPYYGGYNAPVYAPVVALTEEQRKAAVDQQKQFAEQQAKAMQDTIAARRKYDERMRGSWQQPRPFAFDHADHQAQRDEMIKQMEAQRAEMEKYVAEQQKVAQEYRAAMMKDMEARRLQHKL